MIRVHYACICGWRTERDDDPAPPAVLKCKDCGQMTCKPWKTETIKC